MEASVDKRRADRDEGSLEDLPYERVSAGQVQDELRHRLECAEREAGELQARLAEVGAVRDAAAAGLEQFSKDRAVEAGPDESHESRHERELTARLEEAEGMLSIARRQAADWGAVREAAEAGLKSLQVGRQDDGAGSPG